MWKKIRGKRPPASGSSSEPIIHTNSLQSSESSVVRHDASSEMALGLRSMSHRTPTEVTTMSSFEAPGVITNKSRDRSRDRHNEPMGINVVYEPKQTPLVDIIFCHGLGGTSRSTWSKNRDPQLFWPQVWLPLEPDIGLARIISFGYNAHFSATGPAPITGITDFAKDLLYGMKFSKNEAAEDLGIGTRPIIFIVHSMGGLIVKKAYILGQNDDEYKDIVSSIEVIMFLATPHRGTKLAELLNRILMVSIFNHSPRQYISELNKGSSTLEELNEQFRHIAPKLQIFSFYETLPTIVGPKKIMVLEKDSSILGYPGEISKSMDADHHDMSKYTSQKDPNYVIVRNALKDVVTGLKRAGQKLLDAVFSADTKKIENLLSVSAGRPLEDLLTLQKRRTHGTCSWILSAPKFAKWYEESETSEILWLHALPASGKSILSSFIIDSIIEDSLPCEYFFFQFGDQAKRSLSSCLRSLALQTAEHLPSFREALNSLSDSGFRLEKSDARAIWQRIFVAVLFKISSYKTIYWVIDALDESDNPQLAAEILTSISGSKTPIKIVMVSRQSPELIMTFERFTATSKVPFDSMSAAENEQDIRTYVQKEMEFMHATPELKGQIVEKLLARAGGNFLWVRLALEETLMCFTEEDIEEALESIPIGMESLYQRMESTITANARPSHKKLARFIFNWACCSRRPLTLDEITQAIAPLSVFDLTRTIPQVCGQFVVVNGSNRLVMVHETAREYLTRTTNPDLAINPIVVHEQLFTRCITFLEEDSLRRRPSIIETKPFLEYAATSWPYHLHLSSASSPELLTTLVRFLRNSAILNWIYTLAHFGQLRVLIQASQVLSQFVRKKKKLDEGTSPLLHRLTDLDDIEAWTIDCVKIVGKFGANLTSDPNSIFKLIPPFCPKESMIFRQFGTTDSTTSAISIQGLSSSHWDDSLAKISMGTDIQTEKILAAGRFFAIQTSDGKVMLYNETTFEEAHILNHDETILLTAFSPSGNYLVSYGFHSTKVWDVALGKVIHRIENVGRSRALCISFANNEASILIGTDDKTVQIVDLANTKSGWRVLDPRILKEEIPIANSPNCVSFSPDATQVAISYRRFPLTVWSIDPPEIIGRCRRGASTSAWTVVDRVAWHPHSGDLVGVYTDGHIFKWNPSTGFYQEITTHPASEISCSIGGDVFMTGDGSGNIRLYNFQHFSAIYQLSSETPVNGLTFSSDSKRLYDVRGEHCNIWEPNALVRLNELDDRASESASVGDSRTSSSISEVWADLRDPITAIGIPLEGDIYLSGNDGGQVTLYNRTDGSTHEIWRNSNFMSIEHLDLSKDGSHFASADLGGSITVKSIIKKSIGTKAAWSVKSVADIKTEVEVGGIKQLLLSPTSTSLLVASSTSATLYHTIDKSIATSLSYDYAPTKWVTISSMDDYLLKLTFSEITLHKWSDLSEICTFQYSQPLQDTPSHERHNSLFGASEPELEVITTQSQTHILVRLTNPSHHPEKRVLLIPTNQIQPLSTTIILNPIIVPDAVTAQIHKPLNVLSSRLIFMDHNHWICSWLIDERARFDASADSVRKYFFLPRDWLSVDCLRLCRVLGDGKLIIPNKGLVAVIKSGLECAW